MTTQIAGLSLAAYMALCIPFARMIVKELTVNPRHFAFPHAVRSACGAVLRTAAPDATTTDWVRVQCFDCLIARPAVERRPHIQPAPVRRPRHHLRNASVIVGYVMLLGGLTMALAVGLSLLGGQPTSTPPSERNYENAAPFTPSGTWAAQEEVLAVTAAPSADWTDTVALAGHQAEIDRCEGLVLSDYGHWGSSIGEHNHCGGAWILDVEVGDTVDLSGLAAGEYVVTELLDVAKGGTTAAVLDGRLWLQTCHFGSEQMRLVALAPR